MKALCVAIIILNVLVIIASLLAWNINPIVRSLVTITLNLASIVLWVSIYRRITP